jgi:hypothetical protein
MDYDFTDFVKTFSPILREIDIILVIKNVISSIIEHSTQDKM